MPGEARRRAARQSSHAQPSRGSRGAIPPRDSSCVLATITPSQRIRTHAHRVSRRDARVSSYHGWPRDADTYEPYQTIEVIAKRLLRSASRRFFYLYPRFSPTSRRPDAIALISPGLRGASVARRREDSRVLIRVAELCVCCLPALAAPPHTLDVYGSTEQTNRRTEPDDSRLSRLSDSMAR